LQGGLNNMGDSYATPAPANYGPTMAQYAKYLPQVQSETNAGILPTSQAVTKATQQAIPALNALDLKQLSNYALPEAQIGEQISNANALSGAQTNLTQIQGAGGQAATAAQNLENTLSPSEAAAQKGSTAAVNAIDLGGLSPGEEAATERSLNQSNVGTGNLGVLNPTNTISNALNFGGAFNSKIPLMNAAASTASGVASGNPVNPTNVALGQPNTSTLGNFGSTALQTGTSNTSAGASGNNVATSGGLLSGLTSMGNANLGAEAQLGSTTISNSSIPSYLNSVDCCFIFLEAYHGAIPLHVRKARNKVYRLNHDIKTGYVRMAKVLVPLMQKCPLARNLVWKFMINPITNNSGFAYRKKGYTQHRNTTQFWIRIWAILGSI